MDDLKQKLEAKLELLLRRGNAIEGHLRHADGRNELDWADRASLTENDEVLEALEDSTRAEVNAIRAALERMKEGTYEECTDCGEAIPMRRLEALPFATQCVNCAA